MSSRSRSKSSSSERPSTVNSNGDETLPSAEKPSSHVINNTLLQRIAAASAFSPSQKSHSTPAKTQPMNTAHLNMVASPAKDTSWSVLDRTRDRSAGRQLFWQSSPDSSNCILKEPLRFFTQQDVSVISVNGQLRFFNQILILSAGTEKSQAFREIIKKGPYADGFLAQKEKGKEDYCNETSEQQVYIGRNAIFIRRSTVVNRGRERDTWRCSDIRDYGNICEGQLVTTHGSHRPLSQLSIHVNSTTSKKSTSIERQDRILVSFSEEDSHDAVDRKVLRQKSEGQQSEHVITTEKIVVDDLRGCFEITQNAVVRTSRLLWEGDRIETVEQREYRYPEEPDPAKVVNALKSSAEDATTARSIEERTVNEDSNTEKSSASSASRSPRCMRSSCRRPLSRSKSQTFHWAADSKLASDESPVDDTLAERDVRGRARWSKHGHRSKSSRSSSQSSHSAPSNSSLVSGESAAHSPVDDTLAKRDRANRHRHGKQRRSRKGTRSKSQTSRSAHSNSSLASDAKTIQKSTVDSKTSSSASLSSSKKNSSEVKVEAQDQRMKTVESSAEATHSTLESGVVEKKLCIDALIDNKKWRITTIYKLHPAPGTAAAFIPTVLQIDDKTVWKASNATKNNSNHFQISAPERQQPQAPL